MKNRNITFNIILSVLACFALAPQARATCQEGCFTGGNTVLGDEALVNNSGNDNTAIGFNALGSNTTSDSNTATGWQALATNTTGNFNTAIGRSALIGNTTGGSNTATGALTLESNTTGFGNTASGASALGNNESGSDNTAVGFNSLSQAEDSGNIALGSYAGVNLIRGNNNIFIGNQGLVPAEQARIRIGTTGIQKATFIAGITGVTVPAGVEVIVGTDGKLGTFVSSERFKEAVKPMDKTSEAILALKPVTFRYKRELDPDAIPQFGLVAEDVEKLNPDLVARDAGGKPYTVRYEAVNAMLLNEFLKEHKKVEEQQATIAELKWEFHSKLTEQQKRIEALSKGLQRVSAQLEADRSVPEAVAKNP